MIFWYTNKYLGVKKYTKAKFEHVYHVDFLEKYIFQYNSRSTWKIPLDRPKYLDDRNIKK